MGMGHRAFLDLMVNWICYLFSPIPYKASYDIWRLTLYVWQNNREVLHIYFVQVMIKWNQQNEKLSALKKLKTDLLYHICFV